MRLLLIVIALIAGVVLLYFNTFIGAAYLSVLAIVSSWKIAFFKSLRKFLILALLLLFVLLAITEYLPSGEAPHSLAQLRLQGLKQLTVPPFYIEKANEPPPSDPVDDLRADFRQGLVKETLYATVAEDAHTFMHSARGVLITLRQKNDGRDLDRLSQAIDSLEKVLDTHGFKALPDVREKVAKRKAEIEKANTEIGERRDLQEVRDYARNFYIRSTDLKLDQIFEKVVAVQAALNALVKVTVSMNVEGGVSLDEIGECGFSKGKVVYDEMITLQVEEGTLKKADVSNLLLETRYKGYTQDMLYAYHPTASPTRYTPEGSDQHIDFKNGTRNVILYNRIEECGRVHTAPVPVWLRLGHIRSFLIRWPEPYPSKIKLVLDLSEIGLPREYPVIVDMKRDFPIRSISLPANAFIAASESFPPPQRYDAFDVLEPKDLTPGFFQTHNYIWVEYLPSPFRFSKVQEYKTYLFNENLVGAALFAVLGGLAGLLPKPQLRKSPSK